MVATDELVVGVNTDAVEIANCSEDESAGELAVYAVDGVVGGNDRNLDDAGLLLPLLLIVDVVKPDRTDSLSVGLPNRQPIRAMLAASSLSD